MKNYIYLMLHICYIYLFYLHNKIFFTSYSAFFEKHYYWLMLVINRFPPPSQHDDEPDAPLGAPPPYRLPPQPAVNISSPDGNNQYYPGSAQGD